MASDFTIRPETLEDTGTVTAPRRAMFREMGNRDEKALDLMCAAFRPWLRLKMTEQEYIAWFAVSLDSSVAASVGVWLMDWPPHILRALGSPRQRT